MYCDVVAVLPDEEIHPQFFENWGNLNVCGEKIIEDFPNYCGNLKVLEVRWV